MITYLNYKSRLDDCDIDDLAIAFCMTPFTIIVDLLLLIFQPIFILIYIRNKEYY